MEVADFFTTYSTQLAIAFSAGMGLMLGLAYLLNRSRKRTSTEQVDRVLDIVDEHKDDIIVLVIVIPIMARSMFLSNQHWVELIETGQLTLLVASCGFGLAASRYGQSLKNTKLNDGTSRAVHQQGASEKGG